MRSSTALVALASMTAAALALAIAAAPALVAGSPAGTAADEKTVTVRQETSFGEKKITMTYAGDNIRRVIDDGKEVDPGDFGTYAAILAAVHTHDDYARYAHQLAASTRGIAGEEPAGAYLRERIAALAARLDSLRAAAPLPAGGKGHDLHELLETSLFHRLLICHLLEDGLIGDPQRFDLRFEDGGMVVNGEKQPAEVTGRYQAMQKRYGQEKIGHIRLGN